MINKDLRRKIVEKSRSCKLGHCGSALSCVDFINYLYEDVLTEKDAFILSKGHGCMALNAVLEKQGKDVLFKVSCEGGTYVRTLCVDLGEELKIGAHMLELRRTKAGIFEEDTLVNLYDFEKAFEEYEKGNEELLKNIIIPAEIVTELHEPIQIKEDNITQILTGKPIHQNDLVEKQDLEKDKIVSIFHEVKFIGMYKVLNEEGIFAKAEFVMQEIR